MLRLPICKNTRIWRSFLLPIKNFIFGVKPFIGSNNEITDQLRKGFESLNDFKSRLYCSVDKTSSAKRLSQRLSQIAHRDVNQLYEEKKCSRQFSMLF